tara:strand:+ start:766 stop:1119 length:354 start_codon:yes stop_codon:yes gene_type:complete
MADKKNPTKKAVELSKEELAVKRNEITEYYNDHIPHLKAQYEYENLLRDIEKCRAERMQAQMFMSKMGDTPPAPPAPPVTSPGPNLKKATGPLGNAPGAPAVKQEVKRTLKKTIKSE